MGADLIITYTRAPHFATGEEHVPHEIAARVGLARIAKLDLSQFDLDEAALNFGILEDSDYDEMFYAVIREALVRIVTSHIAGRRDVVELQVDGKHYWFTGGMSWGDTPTDSFDEVDLIGIVGLFDQPITAAEILDAPPLPEEATS